MSTNRENSGNLKELENEENLGNLIFFWKKRGIRGKIYRTTKWGGDVKKNDTFNIMFNIYVYLKMYK